MSRPRRLLAVLAVAAAMVTGCGGSAGSTTSAGGPAVLPFPSGLPSVSHGVASLLPLIKAPSAAARRTVARANRRARRRELRRLSRSRSIRAALRHAYLTGNLRRTAYDGDRAELTKASALIARVGGVEGTEERAALGILQELAANHALTAGRLTTAFIQLHRNTTWWSHRGAPAAGQPLIQGRDPVTMKYVPGQGLVVHFLSSWGRVNALARDCSTIPARCARARLRGAIDRMLSLGSERDGFLTWESLFHWDGGAPGWISAITQGTALQALARAASVLQSHRLEKIAKRTLGAFSHRPPVGLSVPARGGRHYLMYSFAPGLRILNGDLRALAGLRDFSRLDHSHHAFLLYKAGADAARREIARDDTGAWSLYSDSGREASFGYHRLATGFLVDLCDITRRRDMCAAAVRFTAYMSQPPRMRLEATPRPRAGSKMQLELALSKISTLNLTVSGPHGTVFARRFSMPRGVRLFSFRAPRRGRYVIRAVARGPSGPLGRLSAPLKVLRSVKALQRAKRHKPVRQKPHG